MSSLDKKRSALWKSGKVLALVTAAATVFAAVVTLSASDAMANDALRSLDADAVAAAPGKNLSLNRDLLAGYLPGSIEREGKMIPAPSSLLSPEVGSDTVLSEIPVSAQLSASPNPVMPGEVVTIAGTGFIPGERITVQYPDGSHDIETADVDGVLVRTITLLPNVYLGVKSFRATGFESGRVAEAETEVQAVAATLIAAPYQAMQGAEIELTGGGFNQGERVTITLPGGEDVILAADRDGIVLFTWAVPMNFTPGLASLMATGDDGTNAVEISMIIRAAGDDAEAGADPDPGMPGAPDDSADPDPDVPGAPEDLADDDSVADANADPEGADESNGVRDSSADSAAVANSNGTENDGSAEDHQTASDGSVSSSAASSAHANATASSNANSLASGSASSISTDGSTGVAQATLAATGNGSMVNLWVVGVLLLMVGASIVIVKQTRVSAE